MIEIISIALTIIASIGVFVGIIWIIINKEKYKDLSEDEKIKKYNIPTAIIVICFIVLFIALIVTGLNSSSTKDDDVDVKKEIEKKVCANKTSDYYKCSWSIIEDRCVCKQR